MKKDNMNKVHWGDIFYADLGKMKVRFNVANALFS